MAPPATPEQRREELGRLLDSHGGVLSTRQAHLQVFGTCCFYDAADIPLAAFFHLHVSKSISGSAKGEGSKEKKEFWWHPESIVANNKADLVRFWWDESIAKMLAKLIEEEYLKPAPGFEQLDFSELDEHTIHEYGNVTFSMDPAFQNDFVSVATSMKPNVLEPGFSSTVFWLYMVFPPQKLHMNVAIGAKSTPEFRFITQVEHQDICNRLVPHVVRLTKLMQALLVARRARPGTARYSPDSDQNTMRALVGLLIHCGSVLLGQERWDEARKIAKEADTLVEQYNPFDVTRAETAQTWLLYAETLRRGRAKMPEIDDDLGVYMACLQKAAEWQINFGEIVKARNDDAGRMRTWIMGVAKKQELDGVKEQLQKKSKVSR